MEDTPQCSRCGRPLQRDREECIYCGRELFSEEVERRDSVLTDDAVRQRLAAAEANLKQSTESPLGPRGRAVARGVVLALSLLALLFVSWLANWNPFFIALGAMFFAIPIWQVFRKL